MYRCYDFVNNIGPHAITNFVWLCDLYLDCVWIFLNLKQIQHTLHIIHQLYFVLTRSLQVRALYK